MGGLIERVDEQDRVLEVVERAEAVRRRWVHRIATTICRDPRGGFSCCAEPRGMFAFPATMT
ncbi:hypothetical protein [Nonomuraea sp. NPDC003804]|uniref:hypothetical protein n=1 Tax=Nonomuraea sp. NPDC003804 TaxID=3154547 RepID=UPI0033B97A72